MGKDWKGRIKNGEISFQFQIKHFCVIRLKTDFHNFDFASVTDNQL